MTQPAALCPICRKPTRFTFRPFCSARCADVDLGRWFTESYRIPASPPDIGEEIADDDLQG